MTFAAENGFGRTDKALHISNTTVPEGMTVASKDTNMKFGLIDKAGVTSSKLYSRTVYQRRADHNKYRNNLPDS